MKRISSGRRNRSSAGVFAPVAIAIFILLCALVRVFLPSVFLAAEAPFLRASAYFDGAVGNVASGFENARALASERYALTAENVQLAEENAVLSAKVADLTALIGSVPVDAPGIAAGVIARPPESPYDTLIVAGGTDDGVAAGDIAYAAGGIPLGVVENVSSNAALIELLSASGVKTEGWLGPARTPITLEGEGGGSFIAQAPRSASTTDDEVYVAGDGSLPIGVVAAASGDPSAPVANLMIKGTVNPFSIPYVLIRPGQSADWPQTASTSAL